MQQNTPPKVQENRNQPNTQIHYASDSTIVESTKSSTMRGSKAFGTWRSPMHRKRVAKGPVLFNCSRLFDVTKKLVVRYIKNSVGSKQQRAGILVRFNNPICSGPNWSPKKRSFRCGTVKFKNDLDHGSDLGALKMWPNRRHLLSSMSARKVQKYIHVPAGC